MADITGQLQASAGAAGEAGNPNAWDISKAYYAGPSLWDVTQVSAGTSYSFATQESNAHGVHFSSDGTKMYIVGWYADTVNQYSLSTAWDVSTASHTSSFSVSAQDTNPTDLFFKPDGTKMYIMGSTGDDVNEYSLSTAWDITTASYVQNFSVVSQDANPNGLFFKSDGTKMYICGSANDNVYEYTLSTAWDVSTASYDQSFSVATQETFPNAISFSEDGTSMYILGAVSDAIWQYTLSTAWDISTASVYGSVSVAALETSGQGLFFKPDGSALYFTGNSSDKVWQYIIGGFSVAAEELAPTGVSFKPDGTKMYVCGTSGDDVNEYSLSTAWDITTASYVQNFSLATNTANPTDIFFKSDGLKMYVVSSSGTVPNAVNEYALSVAWDVSTLSYTTAFSVASQDTGPSGCFFKDDGTKMYVVGTSSDTVHQYTLSTAWDVSSASYDSISFSVAAQELTPSGIFFKPDGTKMYVTGSSGDDVNEYDLSTPWDISSATFVQNAVERYDGSIQGIYWRNNGGEFYLVAGIADKIYKFSISPE